MALQPVRAMASIRAAAEFVPAVDPAVVPARIGCTKDMASVTHKPILATLLRRALPDQVATNSFNPMLL